MCRIYFGTSLDIHACQVSQLIRAELFTALLWKWGAEINSA